MPRNVRSEPIPPDGTRDHGVLEHPMPRNAPFPLVLLCFFLSGLAGLIYETAWTREFAFVFGTSNLAVATVLAAYMAGLASGAAAAARLAQRVRRPILVYGLLELGIGVSALAVPVAVRAARSLYVGLFGGHAGLPDVGGLPTLLFYAACSFAILLPPTAMMGATLPLLARHAVRRGEELGLRVGLLYATNTAGAVTGTLLSAFALLPSLGLRRTIWVAAGVNVLVFLAAAGLARSAEAAPSATASAGARPAGRGSAWILPLIFGSGVVSFSYEILWVRLLEHLLGGSVYAFATMLASFLAGIALGSAAASRLATTARRAALGFGLAQLCIAGLSLAAFVAVDWIPELSQRLRDAGLALSAVDAVAGMLTLFPAALAIGATFPFAVRVLAGDEADAGSVSARVYTANTLGSIVGAVGAGFFLVPELGFAGALVACVGANAALAVAAALLLPPRRPGLALAATAALALCIALPPPLPWTVLRHSSLTRQVNRLNEVEYLGVGRAATILLMSSHGRWFLRTNGDPEGYVDPPGVWHNRSLLERWLGALPVLARPAARSLLVVGFGGGTALESVPRTVERIDVVEIEPEVVAANRVVGERRWRDPLADPRLHVHLNDARNALLLTDTRFDAITSQPSHPWSAGASHLYTREFFELAKSHLTPGGVFTQWIGLGFVDEPLFRSLLATLTAVFEHVRVYSPPAQGGVLFVASDDPLDVEASAAQAIAAAGEDFAELGILVPEDVTTFLLLDTAGARELARGAPQNRDRDNLLQTRSPRIRDRSLRSEIWDLIGPVDALAQSRSDREGSFTLLKRLPPRRAERVARTLRDPFDRRVAAALLEIAGGAPGRARAQLAEVLADAPRHRQARGALLRLAMPELRAGGDPHAWVSAPLDAAEAAVIAGWRALGDGAVSLRGLEPALAAVPPLHPLGQDALRLRAEWRIAAGDPLLAREAIEIADRAIWERGRPGDLMLRARASAVAGESAAVLEALQVVARNLGQGPRARARAGLGLRLLRTLPPDPELAAVRHQIEQTFRARSRGSGAGSGAVLKN